MNTNDAADGWYSLTADLVIGYAGLALVGVVLGAWSLIQTGSAVLLDDTWSSTPAAWFLAGTALLCFLYIGLAREIRGRHHAAIVCTAALTLALLLLLLVYSVLQRSVFFLETAMLTTMSIALGALLRHAREGRRTEQDG